MPPEPEPRIVELKISAPRPDVLYELTESLDASGVRHSDVTRRYRPPDLPLRDMDDVNIWVTKNDEAVQLFNWVRNKREQLSSRTDWFTITISEEKIVFRENRYFSPATDPIDDLRRFLGIDASPKPAT